LPPSQPQPHWLPVPAFTLVFVFMIYSPFLM
jgi:hypothetical protein